MISNRYKIVIFFSMLCASRVLSAGIAAPLELINGVVWNTTGKLLGIKMSVNQGALTFEHQALPDEASRPPVVTFDDIAGLQAPLDEVKEVVEFLKNPERFKALGAHMPRGILLEGAPGTGKTLIAKAIAHHAGCEFVYASASEFVEMYVGVGAKRIRELFDKARKNKPAIIFIDEIDAIGAANRGVGANEEYRQTLNELLTQLDGFRADDAIMVLAATNYAAALDKALTRAGRFDRILRIPLPDQTARKEILHLYIKKLPSVAVSDEVLEDISLRTTGLGGADLKNIVNEAALAAVRDQSTVVNDGHLRNACDKVMAQRRR